MTLDFELSYNYHITDRDKKQSKYGLLISEICMRKSCHTSLVYISIIISL